LKNSPENFVTAMHLQNDWYILLLINVHLLLEILPSATQKHFRAPKERTIQNKHCQLENWQTNSNNNKILQPTLARSITFCDGSRLDPSQKKIVIVGLGVGLPFELTLG